MIEYLKAIVTPLLKEPATLSIEETTDSMGILLSMKVHKDDMGMIIGKNGEMAKSIRHILSVFGGQKKARVSVKFLEPLGSTRIIPESLTETI